MNIQEKIAQIRLEPEHVRLRWVWVSVAISMLFVLAVWIFSIGSLFQGEKNTSSSEDSSAQSITDQLSDLKKQAPSIKDFSDQSLNTAKEGVASTNNSSDFQYPATSDTQTTPQSSNYSDLQQ